MEKIIQRKYKAIQDFKERLLESRVGNDIVEILLFGSLVKERVRRDSDIDLLVFTSDNLDELRDVCAEISFDILMELNESVEPLIYCMDELKRPSSYFLYYVINNGKEIFKMDKEKLKIEEIKGYLGLANEYLEITSLNLENKKFRGAVDAGYDACELSIKGLLLFKIDKLPTTHSGILRKFGQLYIKESIISKEIGKGMSKAFSYRNQARYDFHVRIDEDMSNQIIELAKNLFDILEKKIDKIS